MHGIPAAAPLLHVDKTRGTSGTLGRVDNVAASFLFISTRVDVWDVNYIADL